MGDKSPKSKEKQKKQVTVQKTEQSRKKASDFAKAHPAPATPGKKK